MQLSIFLDFAPGWHRRETCTGWLLLCLCLPAWSPQEHAVVPAVARTDLQSRGMLPRGVRDSHLSSAAEMSSVCAVKVKSDITALITSLSACC